MILPLTDQVAPLVLCHRLKELGAPQDSAFYWQSNVGTMTGPGGSLRIDHVAVVLVLASTLDVGFICAAYTVAELGALMPGRWMDRAYDNRLPNGCESARGATEAVARATLLIALADRGVVKWEKSRSSGS